MNEIQQNILKKLKNHLIYAAVLTLSLLFFVYKGLYYLIIGSYVPLLLISVVIVLFIFSSNRSVKSFKRSINTWAILIIVWSSVRLLLSLTNQFIKPVPESHVAEQLGISGALFSLLFLFGAIYLLRYKKRVFKS